MDFFLGDTKNLVNLERFIHFAKYNWKINKSSFWIGFQILFEKILLISKTARMRDKFIFHYKYRQINSFLTFCFLLFALLTNWKWYWERYQWSNVAKRSCLSLNYWLRKFNARKSSSKFVHKCRKNECSSKLLKVRYFRPSVWCFDIVNIIYSCI